MLLLYKAVLDSHTTNASGTSWVNAVQRSGERYGFADVVEAADPGYGSLDAHAEAGVGDAAVFAQVEVPLEGG